MLRETHRGMGYVAGAGQTEMGVGFTELRPVDYWPKRFAGQLFLGAVFGTSMLGCVRTRPTIISVLLSHLIDIVIVKRRRPKHKQKVGH